MHIPYVQSSRLFGLRLYLIFYLLVASVNRSTPDVAGGTDTELGIKHAFDVAIIQTYNFFFSLQVSVFILKTVIKKSLPGENIFQSTRTKADFYVRE